LLRAGLAAVLREHERDDPDVERHDGGEGQELLVLRVHDYFL
jgi:hypothetical protein